MFLQLFLYFIIFTLCSSSSPVNEIFKLRRHYYKFQSSAQRYPQFNFKLLLIALENAEQCKCDFISSGTSFHSKMDRITSILTKCHLLPVSVDDRLDYGQESPHLIEHQENFQFPKEMNEKIFRKKFISIPDFPNNQLGTQYLATLKIFRNCDKVKFLFAMPHDYVFGFNVDTDRDYLKSAELILKEFCYNEGIERAQLYLTKQYQILVDRLNQSDESVEKFLQMIIDSLFPNDQSADNVEHYLKSLQFVDSSIQKVILMLNKKENTKAGDSLPDKISIPEELEMYLEARKLTEIENGKAVTQDLIKALQDNSVRELNLRTGKLKKSIPAQFKAITEYRELLDRKILILCLGEYILQLQTGLKNGGLSWKTIGFTSFLAGGAIAALIYYALSGNNRQTNESMTIVLFSSEQSSTQQPKIFNHLIWIFALAILVSSVIANWYYRKVNNRNRRMARSTLSPRSIKSTLSF